MAEAETIKLVFADDHEIFREGLRALLQRHADIDIVGECADGDTLLELAHDASPDVVIMDISMPGPGPEAIVTALDARGGDVAIVALTMHSDPTLAASLMALGLNGYVVKENAFKDLTDAVRLVSQGGQFISESLSAAADTAVLTTREIQCLRGLAKGDTAKGVARLLGISERTVRFHVTNASAKLGVKRSTEAVATALNQNLITL